MDEDLTTTQQTRPLHSRARGVTVAVGAPVAAFALMIVISAAFYSSRLGVGIMWINALVQAAILLAAVLFALILRQPLREIFPFKKFDKTMFFGSLLMFLGVFCAGFVLISIQSLLFPRMEQVAEDIGEMMINMPSYAAAVAFFCVLPAICEEALCRGTMLYAMRPFRRVWLRVLVTGLLFGALHGDPLRIVSTAALGMGFAYIVIKSGNLLYPIIWHFVNNFFSVSVTFLLNSAASALPSAGAAEPSDVPEISAGFQVTQTAGLMLIFAGVSGLLIYGGVRRLGGPASGRFDAGGQPPFDASADAGRELVQRRVKTVCLLAIIAGVAAMLGSCVVLVAGSV